VKPHALFTDGMVLQQGRRVAVWGSAADGEEVRVRFQGVEATTTAQGGRWLVHLENLEPGGPSGMSIRGRNEITLKNVYVGEVWVCSGQSNMEWPLWGTADADKAIGSSKNPLLRLFTVPKTAATAPRREVQAAWQECGPDTVANFSAVAYYFGRDLQKARNVPVGLIHTSWGGTPAEAWTCKTALAKYPELQHYVDKADRELKPADEAAKKKYQEALAKYREDAKKAKDEG